MANLTVKDINWLQTLGSYKTEGCRTLTYYTHTSYIDSVSGIRVVYQHTKGEDELVLVDLITIIRELLIHINDLEEEAWEEAMGEDL